MQRACEPRRLGAFCKILSFNLRRWSTVFCFRVEGLGLRVRRWNTIVPFCCRISFLCCRQHSLRATATVRRCSCIYCNQVFQADFHLQFFSATVVALSQAATLSEAPRLKLGTPNHPAFLSKEIKFNTPKPQFNSLNTLYEAQNTERLRRLSFLKGSSSRLDPTWRSTSSGRGFHLANAMHLSNATSPSMLN